MPQAPRKTDHTQVNPKHYSDFGDHSAVLIIRVWDRIRRVAGVEPVNFCVGNALKYMQRAGFKPGEAEVLDLKKADWYLKSRIHELDPSEPDPADPVNQ
jgi:hypothetical protein